MIRRQGEFEDRRNRTTFRVAGPERGSGAVSPACGPRQGCRRVIGQTALMRQTAFRKKEPAPPPSTSTCEHVPSVIQYGAQRTRRGPGCDSGMWRVVMP